jgi:cysteine synthase
MRAANEAYVLVDSSKYGHRCLTSFARLRDVDLTITDNNLSRSRAKILETAGATMQIVDPDKMDLALNSSQTLANPTPSRDNSRPLRQDR